jgi:hypothetical protein
MTKNNTLECWEPKNCGGSSKCGEFITLKLKLLANWVPYLQLDKVTGIGIFNQPPPPDNTLSQKYNFVGVYVPIPDNAKNGDVFYATLFKSDIHNKKLYYLVGDNFLDQREPIIFDVSTNICVNTIPIDNSQPPLTIND